MRCLEKEVWRGLEKRSLRGSERFGEVWRDEGRFREFQRGEVWRREAWRGEVQRGKKRRDSERRGSMKFGSVP